jgi:rod shape-determining protein MreC
MTKSNAESYRKVLLTAIASFFLALTLTSYSAKNPKLNNLGATLVVSILRPFQSAYGWLESSIEEKWDNYIYLVGAKKRNRELENRLFTLEAQNSRLLELKHENLRLKELLNLKDNLNLEGITANVIAYDPSNWSHVVTLDQGTKAGVKIGMPAVVGDGVAGQIIMVSENSARLLLVTDPSSGVDAVLQDKRVRGVVTGVSRFKASWNYVLASEEVQIGERVVTSGLDGVYPKGLLIGVVQGLVPDLSGRLFSRIEIKPAVDFTRLESVLVITNVLTNLNKVQDSNDKH